MEVRGSIHASAALSAPRPGYLPPSPVERWLDGSQSRSAHLAEDKNLLPLSVYKTRFFGCPSRNPVIWVARQSVQNFYKETFWQSPAWKKEIRRTGCIFIQKNISCCYWVRNWTLSRATLNVTSTRKRRPSFSPWNFMDWAKYFTTI